MKIFDIVKMVVDDGVTTVNQTGSMSLLMLSLLLLLPLLLY